jgi:hypothetical protein
MEAIQNKTPDIFSKVYRFFSEHGFDKAFYGESWNKLEERMAIELSLKRNKKQVGSISKKDSDYIEAFISLGKEKFGTHEWFDKKNYFNEVKTELNEIRLSKKMYIPLEYSD